MTPESVDPTQHIFRSPSLQSLVNEAIQFLNNTPIHLLPPVNRFPGVGVYVLYYIGSFAVYEHIAVRNTPQCTQPIYVGKAVPAGWRTARVSSHEVGWTLYGRLREHARSIKQTNNLSVEDFLCRFVILQGAEADLIAAVEAQLIRLYTPLWNTVVDGFGNHDPGKGRYNQAPSEWDILHPGRPWVARLTGILPLLDRIIEKIEQTK